MASRRLAVLAVCTAAGTLGLAAPAASAATAPTPQLAAPHHGTTPRPASPHEFPSAVAKPSASQATASTASAGATFTPLSPTRVLDTRAGTGTGGVVQPLGPNGTITLDLSSVLPTSATSVVFNLTAADVTASTVVTAWPDGAPKPTASNLNLLPGDIRPNLVTVAVGPNRAVDLNNLNGNVDLIADLAGYYSTGAGSLFTSQPPTRVLDTRSGTGTGGVVQPVSGGTSITLDLSGILPTTATAAVFNLTGTDTTASTVVTAWPDGTAQPSASNLNLVAGETAPNLVTVAVPASRKVDLSNLSGNVDLIADLAGYYATDRGNPFHSLTPERALDTRDFNGALGPDTAKALDLTNWLPSTAASAVFNLTGTNTTDSTVVIAWPDGNPKPSASNLNLVAGQTAPNLAITALGSNGRLDLYNLNGSVDLIVDLAGYFGPAPATCTAGCAYAMGDNTYGQLGNGNTGDYASAPAALGGLSNVTQVTGGYFDGYALKSDGSVWGWGDNRDQQLGNGKALGYSTVATPVSTLTSGVTAIAGNSLTTYALKSDGTVWAWGDNQFGQLGNGTTTGPNDVPNLVPVQVSGLTGVVKIATAARTGYALKSDGTLWAWGYNGNGELGTGSTSSNVSTTAVQVSVLTGVTAIGATQSNGYAVKSDGTVWAWGFNGFGGLGNTSVPVQDGSFNATPTQVAGVGNAKSVSSGPTLTEYAVLGDGTVMAWGSNEGGELGTGATGGPTPTATAVPNLSGVSTVAAGDGDAFALKSDGTVWTWGATATTSPAQLAGISAASAVGGGLSDGYIVVPKP